MRVLLFKLKELSVWLVRDSGFYAKVKFVMSRKIYKHAFC